MLTGKMASSRDSSRNPPLWAIEKRRRRQRRQRSASQRYGRAQLSTKVHRRQKNAITYHEGLLRQPLPEKETSFLAPLYIVPSHFPSLYFFLSYPLIFLPGIFTKTHPALRSVFRNLTFLDILSAFVLINMSQTNFLRSKMLFLF